MIGMLRGVFWNAFLALIPLAAGYGLDLASRRVDRSDGRLARLALGPLVLVWLAFLPNTCYLMTEWRHFLFDRRFVASRAAIDPNSIAVVRVAIQAACFLLYSGFGVACFALSIRPVGEALRRLRVNVAWLAAPFFFLTSLGVYLGLIVRLNSWDLVLRPRHVAQIAAGAMANPPLMVVMIGFALLLWLVYLAVDVWLVGFSARLARLRVMRLPLTSEKYRLVPR